MAEVTSEKITIGANPVLREAKMPYDLGSIENPNYMMFRVFTIRGAIAGTGSDGTFIEDKSQQTVCLPIATNPGATYAQGWDEQKAGATASALIEGASTGFKNSGGVIDSMLDKISSAGDQLSGVLEDSWSLVGTGAGKVLNNQALGQAGGLSAFEQIYGVYSGPGYRTFNFTYSLKPMSEGETDTVREIVKFFKIHSAPKVRVQHISRIYSLPKAFKITHHYRAGENDNIHKIGYCACTSVGVAYGGDKFTTFDGSNGAPVQIELTLAFKELTLQSQKSIEEGY